MIRSVLSPWSCTDVYKRQLHISTNWFIRNFKLYMKISPAQYILSLRMVNAQSLLAVSYTHLDVYKRQHQGCDKEPAERTGFIDQKVFHELHYATSELSLIHI